MQISSAKTASYDQGLAQNKPGISSDNEHSDRSFVESDAATSRNDQRINAIFGNNLSLQRDTFMAVGVAVVILLPLIVWVRGALGSFHPLSPAFVLIAMVCCLPAIFSAYHPKLERFAGHSLIALLAAIYFVLVVLNGGIRAPLLVIAPLLPLTAAFLLGPPAGVLMAGLVIVGIAALVTQSGPTSALPEAANAAFLIDPLPALATAMFVAVVSVAAACIGWGFNRRFLIVQEELIHLATHDPLTNLANRKSLESALYFEAGKRRTTYPVSLIVFDIDHFKRFNDCHGHQAGDQILKTVADIALANVKRSSDVIARYGGDEFVVVLPDTSHNDAMQIAERLREAVEKQQCELSTATMFRAGSTGNPDITTATTDNIITLSVGVATQPAGHHSSPEEFVDDLMARADAAMYGSKQSGGNRVVAAENIFHSVDQPTEGV